LFSCIISEIAESYFYVIAIFFIFENNPIIQIQYELGTTLSKRQGDTSKRLRIEQDDTRLGFEVDYDRIIFG
jgi:hypothetical protein